MRRREEEGDGRERQKEEEEEKEGRGGLLGSGQFTIMVESWTQEQTD